MFEAAGCRLTEATVDLLCCEPRCDSLRVLNLSSCDLDESHAKRIVESCRFLQALDLSNNNKINGTIVFSAAAWTQYRTPASTSHLASERAASRKRKRSSSALEDAQVLDISPFDCDPMQVDHVPEPLYRPASKRRATAIFVSPLEDATASNICKAPVDIQKQFYLYKLNISGCSESICDAVIKCVAQSFPCLTELDISNCPRVTDLTPIIQNCPNLAVLNASGTNISFSKSRALPAPSTLEEFRYSGSGCLDTPFETFLSGCTSTLRVLELRNKVFEDPSTLSRVLAQANALAHLDLYGTDIDGSVLNALVQNGSVRDSLLSLNVGNCLELGPSDWMDALLPLVSGNVSFSNLQSFNVSGLKDRVPIESVGLFGRCSPNIVALSLGHVSDQSSLRQPEVAQVLAAFPGLTSLEVWSCDSVSLTLLSMIPQLLCRSIRAIQVCSLQARGDVQQDDEHDDDHEPAAAHRHGGHRHLDSAPRSPCLTLHQLSRLKHAFPDVSFKLWQHSVRGERFYQENNTSPSAAAHQKISTVRFEVSRLLDPLLAEDIDETHDSDDSLLAEAYCRVSVIVDGAYLWPNENSLSFDVLSSTTPASATFELYGGAVPLIRDWCCDCNIEEFAGVLFSVDRNYVRWDIREPGPDLRLRFHFSQYMSAIAAAREQLAYLLSTIRAERFAARLQADL